MYEIKEVIPKSDGQADKSYHKMLFDRVFSLHRMLEKRVVKIDEYNNKIASIESEIRTLEKSIQYVVKDIDKEKKDITEIQQEIMAYRAKIESFKQKDTLLYEPTFDIRTYQRGKNRYWYIEGRVRLPMVNGKKGKEFHTSFGRYEDVVAEYRELDRVRYNLLGIFTGVNGTKQRKLDNKLQNRLTHVLKDWWWNGI